MHRSFLKCDDPKGVVECGTIRKYRTRSHKVKDKTKIQKTSENLETSLINNRYKVKKVAKGCDGNLIGPSSLHLTQASAEDTGWNNILDSWSRDIMCERKSKDIAKGNLRGAIGRQDSVSMLRKLQEKASQHTATFGRKQTKKPERDRTDGNRIGRTQANPLGEQSNPKGFHRPETSACGSSSNCKEELKKVVTESLVWQNMFPKTTEGFDSGSETFSSSTSQCSGVRTNSLSDHSLSVIAPKTERGPSLVFKLMGLEEAPSKSFPAIKQKLLDGKIDMSKVRRKDHTAERGNPEQKGLRETLDTMHFKSILKERFVKDPKLRMHHFNDTSSKQFGDLSRIALMKPQCNLYQESVKRAYIPILPKDFPITKLKAEIASSKTIKQRKGSSSANMGKEMENGIRKRLNKEEGPRFLEEIIKLESKGSYPVEEYSGKVRLYCHIGHTSQVNETIDRKWKVQPISGKQPEKDISQPTTVAKPQYQRREIPSTKLRKLRSGSRIDKNEISYLKSTGSNNTCTQETKNSKDLNVEIKKINSVVDSLTGRTNQMKNQIPVAEPEPAKLTVEQIMRREKKKIFPEIRIATRLEDELLMLCEADAFINKIGEKCKQRKNSSGNDLIMPLRSEHINDAIAAYSIDAGKEGTELKHFLLTSPSFIGHAKKLFNLDVDYPNTLQKNETIYSMLNLRLYLDCAYELSERKSLQESQVARSLLLACGGNSRLQMSLGRLVEEICDGIENLKFYKEDYDSGAEGFEDNDVFAMMEKDMKCNGETNGMWESGWKRGFCADEAGLVVNKIESLLITGLIEDLVINL
ncbi:unnamed protein product [Sphenostylis stenocarpa]|uniref:DUF4378 domain-containing protein n=1 Tax=Sphenostylis stenocarpa TaxID=92480 RepID=A0AA86S8W1_9FABA|nr:unnamed protein product [Sphenostylis stenocarpa]